MPVLVPDLLSPQLQHELDLWEREELFRFYVNERRANCHFLEIQNLWVLAPQCDSCAYSRPDYRGALPDSTPESWQEDLALILGDDDELSALEQGEIPSPPCHSCGRSLDPRIDAIYADSYHLEEHFGVPLTTLGQIQPGKAQQRQLFRIYGDACFRCGTTDDLHVDHIRPRSGGGDAAFRNLQPLCERCGQLKGDGMPVEVTAYSTLYFTDPPSDAFEGLFW